MTDKISKRKKIIGWTVFIIGALFLINSADHFINSDRGSYFDDVFINVLTAIGGIDLYFAYLDFLDVFESIHFLVFAFLNMDYILLFVVGVALVLISLILILKKVSFRRKK